MEPDSRKFNKKNPNLNNPSIPQIDNSLKQQVELPLPKAEINNSAENKGLQENTKISKKESESYIKDLKISREELKRYVKSRKNTKKLNEKILKKEDYSIYKPSSLGEFANKLMKNISYSRDGTFVKKLCEYDAFIYNFSFAFIISIFFSTEFCI